MEMFQRNMTVFIPSLGVSVIIASRYLAMFSFRVIHLLRNVSNCFTTQQLFFTESILARTTQKWKKKMK